MSSVFTLTILPDKNNFLTITAGCILSLDAKSLIVIISGIIIDLISSSGLSSFGSGFWNAPAPVLVFVLTFSSPSYVNKFLLYLSNLSFEPFLFCFCFSLSLVYLFSFFFLPVNLLFVPVAILALPGLNVLFIFPPSKLLAFGFWLGLSLKNLFCWLRFWLFWCWDLFCWPPFGLLNVFCLLIFIFSVLLFCSASASFFLFSSLFLFNSSIVLWGSGLPFGELTFFFCSFVLPFMLIFKLSLVLPSQNGLLDCSGLDSVSFFFSVLVSWADFSELGTSLSICFLSLFSSPFILIVVGLRTFFLGKLTLLLLTRVCTIFSPSLVNLFVILEAFSPALLSAFLISSTSCLFFSISISNSFNLSLIVIISSRTLSLYL